MLMLWQDRDTRVVQHVLGGKHNEFSVLVERYLSVAQAVARGNLINPADMEDVVQESFVAAFQKLDTLTKPQRFGPWLITIVRNTARSWSRRQGREISLDAIKDAEPLAITPPVEKEEMRRILEHTLSGMELEQREILMLHYYAGKSLREIAQLHGISREAAAKRLQRARLALGEELLKVVPEERPAEEITRKRAKAIVTVAVAAPIAWKASPAYAATAMTIASVAKWTIASALVAGTATVAYVAAPKLLAQPQTPSIAVGDAGNSTSIAAAKPPTVTAPTPASEGGSSASSVDSDIITPLPVGTNTLKSMLVDLQDKPIPNTDVTIELINWKPTEIPPKQTARWTGRSDADGRFVFENLPDGPYCITAMANGLGGANDALAQPKRSYTPQNVKMYPAITSGGVLTDETGAPVAGAVLYPVKHVLFPEEEFDHWTVASIRARTDENGRFQFKGLIPGGWILYVVAPNRAPMYSAPMDVPATNAEVVFGTPGGFKGRVVDARDGEPMPQVKLIAAQGDLMLSGVTDSGEYQETHRIALSAMSNDNGEYSFDAIYPGDYQILVEDPMLCLAVAKLPVTVEPGKVLEGFDIRVSTGGQIAGRVLDRKTQQAIPGATVSVYGKSSEKRKEVGANSAGEYRITGLPPGVYFIELGKSPEGYVQPHYDDRFVNVTLESPQEGVDFVLDPAARVSGIVVDAEGKPAEGVQIDGRTEIQNNPSYERVESAPDGSFALTRLPGNGSLVISASKGDWKAADFKADLKDELNDVTLILDTLAASTIEGTVVDAKGKPIQAQVFGKRVETGQENEGGFAERTAADGKFLVENVRAGRYVITATPGTGRYVYTGFVEEGNVQKPLETVVEVHEREKLHDVVVHTGESNNETISGKVVSPDGKPILYAAVAMVERRMLATAKLGGAFTFEGLPKGSFTIYAASPGYSPVVAPNVAAGTKDLVIKLDRTASLRGRVVDASNKSPLDTFDVAYRCTTPIPLEATPGAEGQQRYKAAAGEFVLEGLPTLPLTVTVKAEGYAPWETPLEGLKGGQENPVLVELSLGGTIEGFVHDAAGNPLGETKIVRGDMLGHGPDNPVLAITTADGRFTLKDQKSDQAIPFVASRDGYAATTFQVTPSSGEASAADVLMEKSGTLRVRARRCGQPQANVDVYLEYQDPNKKTSGMIQPRSSDDEDCVVKDVAPGDVQVHVGITADNGRFTQEKEAVIVGEQETLVEVDFECGACTIEGQLTLNGVPAAQSVAYIEGPDKILTFSKVTDSEGNYRFERLPAGEYRVHLQINNPNGTNTANKWQTVTLDENAVSRVDWDLKSGGTVQGTAPTPLINCDRMCVLAYAGVVDAKTYAEPAFGQTGPLVGSCPVDADGHYQIEYLDAGTYTVILTCTVPSDQASIPSEPRFQVVNVPQSGTMDVAF